MGGAEIGLATLGPDREDIKIQSDHKLAIAGAPGVRVTEVDEIFSKVGGYPTSSSYS